MVYELELDVYVRQPNVNHPRRRQPLASYPVVLMSSNEASHIFEIGPATSQAVSFLTQGSSLL